MGKITSFLKTTALGGILVLLPLLLLRRYVPARV
jgi:hypothetical protein